MTFTPKFYELILVASCLLAGIFFQATCAFTPARLSTNHRAMDTTELTYIQRSQQDVVVEAFTEKKQLAIAKSFVPDTYRSHPLLTNQHFQTILGVFIRDSPGCAYIEKSNTISEILPVGKAIIDALPSILGFNNVEDSCTFWDERERFDTPDGDFFDVDYKFQDVTSDTRATVMIIHGLESNSNSSFCINMARAYTEKGFDVACINFRGCSGEPNNTLLQYHAGFTDDLYVFLNKWSKRNSKPIYVTGFSLGANVAMKLISELGKEAITKYNIRGAAVSAAPFGLTSHWRQLIDDPFNKQVYAGTLMKSMKKKVEHITERYLEGNTETDVFDYWKAMNATTIPEIEDAMIAPLYGFSDKFDYYDRTTPIVDDIAVPTFVLNSADDPFFNRDVFPSEIDCSDKNDGVPIKIVRTEYGGHLGHLFHFVDADDDAAKPVASFAPMQLAKFLDHIHNNSN